MLENLWNTFAPSTAAASKTSEGKLCSPDKKNNVMKIKSKITHLNVDEIASKTGNIYKSVRVIGKRARQLSATQKEELNEKLAEFASDVDNLEEVFENREQIEISRYFERLPKSTTVAAEELVEDELFFRKPSEEEEDNTEIK